ncbi:MAG: DNA methyltransferase [Terriglobales bacterium]
MSNHDAIFFYTKSGDPARVWNQLYMRRAKSTLKRFGDARIISGFDEEGRRLPSQMAEEASLGVPRDDVWYIRRVPPIKQIFPTQKPERLLERIIDATTNPGDVVLDAYCGCGTTVFVAEKLHRNWIGIDITYQAISVILARFEGEWGAEILDKIEQDGVPRDMESAHALATKHPEGKLRKEFEKWAVLTYTNNAAIVHPKKGADRGIDGVAYFYSQPSETSKMVFQVKSGGVGRGDIAKLNSDREREGAEISVFLTLEDPSRAMLTEARSVSPYIHPLTGKSYDRIQIVTIREMLEEHKRVELPLNIEVVRAFQNMSNAKQLELNLTAGLPERKQVVAEIVKRRVRKSE